jgi:DNA repair photolyase
MEAILEAAREAGASVAAYIPLRLPGEVMELFLDWLSVHAPQRKERALSLIRQMRGGKLNDPNFGSRFQGEGAYAALLRQRFYVATRRLGLAREGKALESAKFARPPAPGEQLSLL